MFKNVIYVFLVLIFSFSCTKKHSPEGFLKEFISYRAKNGSNKQKVLSMLTGEAKKEVESLNEEELEKYLNLPKIKNHKVKILSKNCESETSCFLTYVIKYAQLGKNKANFKLEVKKIAEVIQIDGKWKVGSLSNVKTYIDSQKELSEQDIPK
jgi:hypothetical protein